MFEIIESEKVWGICDVVSKEVAKFTDKPLHKFVVEDLEELYKTYILFTEDGKQIAKVRYLEMEEIVEILFIEDEDEDENWIEVEWREEEED